MQLILCVFCREQIQEHHEVKVEHGNYIHDWCYPRYKEMEKILKERGFNEQYPSTEAGDAL